MTLSTRDLLTLKAGYKPRTKFRNIPTEIDGIKFDSRAEARRWGELKLLQRAGEIGSLERQVRFALELNGELICTYIADHVYTEQGVQVVEDVKSKSTKTPVYRIKKKLMKVIRGIDIREVA